MLEWRAVLIRRRPLSRHGRHLPTSAAAAALTDLDRRGGTSNAQDRRPRGGHCQHRTSDPGSSTFEGFPHDLVTSGDHVTRQIDWIRQRAGPRFGSIELSVFAHHVAVTDDADQAKQELADRARTTTNEIAHSPHVLIGPTSAIVETLLDHRERAERDTGSPTSSSTQQTSTPSHPSSTDSPVNRQTRQASPQHDTEADMDVR